MERIERNYVLREDLNEKDASPSFSRQAKRFGKRHVLVVLGMLGFANVYALRVNLSVALVAMVNSTFANANSEANSRGYVLYVALHEVYNFTSGLLLKYIYKISRA